MSSVEWPQFSDPEARCDPGRKMPSEVSSLIGGQGAAATGPAPPRPRAPRPAPPTRAHHQTSEDHPWAPLAWAGRREHAQAGRPYLPPQASTPTTSPRPRAICALCRLAGTAEPQPLTSGRADCPQEPGPGGDLAGSTRGAPPQPGEAGAAAPRRHLEIGAWRAPTRLPAVSQETPKGF